MAGIFAVKKQRERERERERDKCEDYSNTGKGLRQNLIENNNNKKRIQIVCKFLSCGQKLEDNLEKETSCSIRVVRS